MKVQLYLKAITAAVGAAVAIIVDEDTAQAVVASLTALMVFVVPNHG